MSEKHAILGLWWSAVAGIFAYAAYVGMFPDPPQEITVGISLATIIFFIWWCQVDARSGKAERVRGYETLLLVIIPPLGMAAYLFRSRPFAIALMTIVLLAVGFITATLIGAWLGSNVL